MGWMSFWVTDEKKKQQPYANLRKAFCTLNRNHRGRGFKRLGEGTRSSASNPALRHPGQALSDDKGHMDCRSWTRNCTPLGLIGWVCSFGIILLHMVIVLKLPWLKIQHHIKMASTVQHVWAMLLNPGHRPACKALTKKDPRWWHLQGGKDGTGGPPSGVSHRTHLPCGSSSWAKEGECFSLLSGREMQHGLGCISNTLHQVGYRKEADLNGRLKPLLPIKMNSWSSAWYRSSCLGLPFLILSEMCWRVFTVISKSGWFIRTWSGWQLRYNDTRQSVKVEFIMSLSGLSWMTLS